jgi:surface polysaccharide O-acyltransferase-like enzyme
MLISGILAGHLAESPGYHNTQYFASFLSINVVLMSVSSFRLVRGARISDSIRRWLAPLSKASFDIYLVHVIVVETIQSIPLSPPCILPGVHPILHRIPVVRWVVP